MSFSKHLCVIVLSTGCLLSGCHRPEKRLEPTVHCPIHPRQLKKLSSAFEALCDDELCSTWGSEYLVGVAFAKDLDFYRAITSFKRALILADRAPDLRKMQIEYSILLSYFLAGKYVEVTRMFEKSYIRSHITKDFAAFHDLLIILHESYTQCDKEEEADEALSLLQKQDEPLAQKVAFYNALSSGDFKTMEPLAARIGHTKDYSAFKRSFKSQEKSMETAATLSMFLPGAGYLYVGQKRSAITSFLMNSLFITAAVTFFSRGHIAAGVITTGFEMGWYFGGIYGSSQAAKKYNESLYSAQANFIAEQHNLGPSLNLRFAF